MGNYVNESLLGTSPLKSQQEEAKKLVSKWEKTGLLDGLNEDFKTFKDVKKFIETL